MIICLFICGATRVKQLEDIVRQQVRKIKRRHAIRTGNVGLCIRACCLTSKMTKNSTDSSPTPPKNEIFRIRLKQNFVKGLTITNILYYTLHPY
jgi:hypothetical protein